MRHRVARRIRSAAGLAMCLPVALLLCLAAIGCSTKKNTAMSRQWQAFTTRYNVYFNGSEHYNETLKKMEEEYEDDYTRRLLMHPAEARSDEKMPQPSGNFDRTIEKMQKSIQLHSIKKKPAKRSASQKEKEFRAREEFNPFLHNAWLMMGRAQYLNGDFLGAASTFFYISRHFRWLPEVVTEAQLWQARAYCAMGWTYEAENLLVHIKDKHLTNNELRNLYNFVQADYNVLAGNDEKAVPYLEAAAKAAKGTQRNRIYFLLGQTLQRLDRRKDAYAAYRNAGKGMSLSYRAKFNARIRQSEVYTGTNIKGEVNALRAMTRYQRNKEYFDQIYYAIGNLYLSRCDTTEAIASYRKAVKESTRNGIDKALAQIALGNLLFLRGDYVGAQPCYSEAMPQLPETFTDYRLLKRRSDVLDELATYAANLQLQDSLLTLSKLPENEQMKVCQRLADELKKREKESADSARRAEFEANRPQDQQQAGANTPQQYTLNTDKSWYFYNQQAKNAGRTEFQRLWGARKLEDDWRRRDKTSYSLGNEEFDYSAADSTLSGAAADTTQRKEGEPDPLNDPHYPEYYFKNIPHTEAEIQNCNDIIQESLYNLGLVLKDKLEDFPAARRYFLELLSRYPDNVYRLDTYYNLYLMAIRREQISEAEKWRQAILNDFPDSPYGQAMTDPNYFENMRRMDTLQEEIYAEAYADYLGDRNSQVHSLTQQMEEKYPLSRILPKFVFIDALSYLTEKDYVKFRERLEYLLDRWPDTDMTDIAGRILTDVKKGRKLYAGTTNTRGMIWQVRLSNDTTALDSDGKPAAFERDPEKPQLLVLAFALDSVNPNQVLFDVARNNFSWFVVRDYDLEPMSFGNVGLLVIRGFANQRELDHYISIMERENNFDLPEAVRPIPISVANFELLLRQGRSFEEYFRFRDSEENPDETLQEGQPDAAESTAESEQSSAQQIQGEESGQETESPKNSSEENNAEENQSEGNNSEESTEDTATQATVLPCKKYYGPMMR